MPNWVYNTLTIQGPKEQVDSIKDRLNAPYKKTFENWNMQTGQMEFKEHLFPNPVFAFYNIYNHRQAGITDLEYVAQPPRDIPIEEAMQCKTNDWYNWNVRNWGTKWDVAVGDNEAYSDTYIEGPTENGENLVVYYNFHTAWSPPYPAMEKLSAQYPKLLFTLSYEEETGWGGEAEFLRGKLISESTYDNKCRDCDEINTMEYCENDCGEICSSCNYMGEADLECVKECQTHKIYLDSEHVPDYRMEQING